MKWLFSVSIVAMLAACNSNPNEAAIEEVTVALDKINKADSSFKMMDVEKVQPYIDTISFDVRFVQQEYSDTMPLLLAAKVDVYQRLIKSISRFNQAYADQKKDLEYSRNQLQNLKSDLENNVIDSSGFSSYFPAEKNAVDRLVESNSNLLSWYNSIETGFVKYKKPIDSLIVEIKKKQGY